MSGLQCLRNQARMSCLPELASRTPGTGRRVADRFRRRRCASVFTSVPPDRERSSPSSGPNNNRKPNPVRASHHCCQPDERWQAAACREHGTILQLSTPVEVTSAADRSVKRPGQKPYAVVVGRQTATGFADVRTPTEDAQPTACHCGGSPSARVAGCEVRFASPGNEDRLYLVEPAGQGRQKSENMGGPASRGKGWPTLHLHRCRLVRYYRAAGSPTGA